MTTIASASLHYQLSGDDVLWAARATVHEIGGDSPQQAADVLWTMTQRFVLRFEQGQRESFGVLVRRFSQPVNPRWTEEGVCGPGGSYEGSGRYCSPSQLRRRAWASGASWGDLVALKPAAMAVVEQWAVGWLANPVPRATNFAATAEARSYIERSAGATMLSNRPGANAFIVEAGAADWPYDHVVMVGGDGHIASAV